MRLVPVAAAGSFVLASLTPISAAPASGQEPADNRVCMARMTTGKAGGDHEIRLQVAPADAVFLAARGYQRRSCTDFADMLRDSVVEMCRTARLGDQAIDQDFAAIHSLTPREICEIGERA